MNRCPAILTAVGVLHYPAQMALFLLHLYVSIERLQILVAPSEGCSFVLADFLYSKPLSITADAFLISGAFSEFLLDRLKGLMGMWNAAMKHKKRRVTIKALNILDCLGDLVGRVPTYFAWNICFVFTRGT